jgi:hypothetical protein
MARNVGRTQAELEARLLEAGSGQGQRVQAAGGDPNQWLLQLGPYTLFLHPLDQHWWYWDNPHQAWRDSSFRAGQVTFELRGDEIEVVRTAMAQPAVPATATTWALAWAGDSQPGIRLGPNTLIGRGEGNDVVVKDGLASRRHAVIRAQGDRCTIEDLGSSNGTFVNGVRIAAPTALRPGDIVAIGSTQLVVRAG